MRQDLLASCPELLEEVPEAAVEYGAGLVKVPAADFVKYSLMGRTAKYHRARIRQALGFCPATLEEEEQLTGRRPIHRR